MRASWPPVIVFDIELESVSRGIGHQRLPGGVDKRHGVLLPENYDGVVLKLKKSDCRRTSVNVSVVQRRASAVFPKAPAQRARF
jgi:hypothetical protein